MCNRFDVSMIVHTFKRKTYYHVLIACCVFLSMSSSPGPYSSIPPSLRSLALQCRGVSARDRRFAPHIVCPGMVCRFNRGITHYQRQWAMRTRPQSKRTQKNKTPDSLSRGGKEFFLGVWVAGQWEIPGIVPTVSWAAFASRCAQRGEESQQLEPTALEETPS